MGQYTIPVAPPEPQQGPYSTPADQGLRNHGHPDRRLLHQRAVLIAAMCSRLPLASKEIDLLLCVKPIQGNVHSSLFVVILSYGIRNGASYGELGIQESIPKPTCRYGKLALGVAVFSLRSHVEIFCVHTKSFLQSEPNGKIIHSLSV